RATVEVDVLTDDFRIAAITPLPQPVRDDDGARRPGRAEIVGLKRPTEQRRNAQHGEVILRNDGQLHALRLAHTAAQINLGRHAVYHGDVLEYSLSLPIQIIGVADAGVVIT